MKDKRPFSLWLLDAAMIGMTVLFLLLAGVALVKAQDAERKQGYVQAVVNPAIVEDLDLAKLRAVFAAGCAKDGLDAAVGMGRLDGTQFISLIFSCTPPKKQM